MRVAIVGAGISGLVVAHALQSVHDVSVFEAADYAGGHTNTIAVPTAAGSLQVDTGFIVFNNRNYPNFERLLARIGVRSQPSNMSFGVSDRGGRFEYAARSLNSLYAVRRHFLSPSFQRMVAEVPRFQRAARQLLESDGASPSLRQWLERERFSDGFVERLIVPQVAAVWSADPRQMSSFPARFLAEFFDNHGMLSLRGRPQWRVVAGGSQQYVKALTAPLKDRIHVSSPVQTLTRDRDGVSVTVRGQPSQRFDQVVIATHSDQALAMLADASDRERELLGAFPYQLNEAVLHTDVRVMPARRRAWASWNYHLTGEQSAAAVTYDMNRLQSTRRR
jgi:predicted NAD/FAD-binding protein